MKKYRIYSGAKPTSADKTFAVNWGGKYFAVSPIAGGRRGWRANNELNKLGK